MTATDKVGISHLRLLILVPIPRADNDNALAKVSIHSPQLAAATNSVFAKFLRGLTDSAPSADVQTFAGYTSHTPLRISNKYYTSDINLWCDELPPQIPTPDGDDSSLGQWTEQMLSAEAREVREVIGGIVLVLPYLSTLSTTNETRKAIIEEYVRNVEAVAKVRDLVEDESGRDLASIIIVQDMTSENNLSESTSANVSSFAETLEDSCLSDYGIFGFDTVAWQPAVMASEENITNKNEFGEKLGMARVVEVLEQANWSTSIGTGEDDFEYGLTAVDDFSDLDDDLGGLGLRPKIKPLSRPTKDPVTAQSDEFQREIMGLHFALEEQSQRQTDETSENGNDPQVEQLAGMMDRVVAIREAGMEMSEEDRKKFAKREIAKIMRDMDFD